MEPLTQEERDAIEGMAFALDYVAESVRARPSGCSGDFKLGRRPLTHIRRLDSEVLADRIAEKVASRLRAEENGGADNARIA